MNNGLYGNMMIYFQAQFIDLENFDMLPLVTSGYDKTKQSDGTDSEVSKFRGALQNLKGNEIKDSNGNIIFVTSGDLWSDIELKLGTFIKDPLYTETYRIMKNNGWNKEGGFFSYNIVEVIGNDGQLTNDLIFNKGEDNFL